jgi:predicted regulator of Ras-like GTPase activity (Roadblock/LC7/MglB family)
VSAFNEILRAMVERVPGALGAVFVAWDGEPVGAFSTEMAPLDLEILGAQWVLAWAELGRSLARARLGRPLELRLDVERASVLIREVSDQYCVVLAARRGAHLGTALRALDAGAARLRVEMG